MESLLERGEKLDDLVAKSEHLGNQSKAFYKTVSTKPTCQPGAKARLSVRSLTALPCVPVQPAGTETELLLRSHVMPLPCPRGPASLCLSALPTAPIMPPVVEWVDRRSPEVGGIRCKKGLRGGTEVWPLQIAVDCVCVGGGGVKEMMGLFRGRSDICIIFKLYKCKHLCGVWPPARHLTFVYWWCLLMQFKII